jgi:K+-transporting ATPase A subunit
VGWPRARMSGLRPAIASRRSAAGNEPRAGSGRFNSALFATVTTDTSCGAVNAMHDSFTPLGSMVPLVNIQLGDSMLSIHSGCTGTRYAPGTWSLW